MSKDADGTAVGLLFDSQNRLAGHAKLRWVDDAGAVEEVQYISSDVRSRDDDSGSRSGVDESAPDISRLVPLALVAVAGIAAGVAGVKVAQHVKKRRQAERAELRSGAPASATPAGWYEVAANPTQLRFWDGAAWSNDYAQRASTAPAIAADWYPDPSNAAQIRYWDGSAWTHYVSPRSGAVTTPADWYPDPSNAMQLRYWDGSGWTNHVTAGPGARGAVHNASAIPSNAWRPPAYEEPRIHMSSAEWQAHVEAWARTGAIQQELWSRLTNARISDADDATLEAQRHWEELTPQEGALRIKLMLDANPSLRDQDVLVEFIRHFGGGQGAPLAVPDNHNRRR